MGEGGERGKGEGRWGRRRGGEGGRRRGGKGEAWERGKEKGERGKKERGKGEEGDNDLIYKLSLVGLSLRGALSPFLSNCSNLQTLDLSYNHLTARSPAPSLPSSNPLSTSPSSTYPPIASPALYLLSLPSVPTSISSTSTATSSLAPPVVLSSPI
ncbi:hypothetical protein EJ110_NYTH13995 [Nymphaea thermarum]|nr:hypothetical protein EJ110_NYTH13995 [Nymphaea thermarum]